MKRTKHPTKATLDRTPDTTGRDGAIDFVAKVGSSEPVILNRRDDRFTRVMVLRSSISGVIFPKTSRSGCLNAL
jgi:hypothetical protein